MSNKTQNYMDNWPNILTASTNIFAVFPLYVSYKYGDYTTTKAIAFAFGTSFVSHLFESHKHGNKGFNAPKILSKILNITDIIGACTLAFRIFQITKPELLWNPIIQIHIVFALIAALCALISEWDKTEKTQKRWVIFHNIWHPGIFLTLGSFLLFLYQSHL